MNVNKIYNALLLPGRAVVKLTDALHPLGEIHLRMA